MFQEKDFDKVLLKNAHAFAADIAEERGFENLLYPKEAMENSLSKEIIESVQNRKEKIDQGLECMLQSLDYCQVSSTEKQLLIEELEGALSKINSEEALQKLGQATFSDISWKEYLCISDAAFQTLYTAAKALFESKRFAEAEKAFFFLCAFDPTKYAYWLGLAYASFQEKLYEESIHAYTVASAIDPESEVPYIFVAEVFQEIQDFENATIALDSAIALLSECVPKDISQIQKLQEKRITCAHRARSGVCLKVW